MKAKAIELNGVEPNIIPVIGRIPGLDRVAVCKEEAGRRVCAKVPRKAARNMVGKGPWKYEKITPIPFPRPEM